MLRSEDSPDGEMSRVGEMTRQPTQGPTRLLPDPEFKIPTLHEIVIDITAQTDTNKMRIIIQKN